MIVGVKCVFSNAGLMKYFSYFADMQRKFFNLTCRTVNGGIRFLRYKFFVDTIHCWFFSLLIFFLYLFA